MRIFSWLRNLYVLTSFSHISSVSGIQTWNPTIVSKASLFNATLTSKQVSASLDTICAMIASRLPWARLFCIMNGGCRISSLLVAAFDPGSGNDPVNCMTNFDGCLDGSTVIKPNALYFPQMETGNAFKCVNSRLIDYHPPPMRNRCLYGMRTYLLWSEVRETCSGYGGDIATLGNLNCPAFMSLIGSIVTGGYITIGIYGNGTNFKWNNGTAVNLTATKNMWASGYPNASINPACGECYDVGNIGLHGLACNNLRSFSCCEIILKN